MSHVRHTPSQGSSGGGGRDAAAPPVDRQRAVQVEQVYKQCQFILKPRPTETLHASAGELVCRLIIYF